ncbi:phosphatase PAP2 family protein [Leptolyngbya sp. NIES-2104]|uniref:phosphatase PAP2 family protein n=1 Tax=Leptolyngbya sp. NIES-2104 TaxID=1552121 RepID=UPI0006EC8C34|nr:phosphatase PAP2 family protein [Leptolyngbya sp. NIES-2104]GAP94477.1 membrane-associated phospholipid phosphatase [Leptolyngbya sp. NIES-2104]
MLIEIIRRSSRRILTFWRRKVGNRVAPLLTAIRLTGLVAAAIALWGFAELAETVMRDQTQAFDTSVLLAIQKLQAPWLTPIIVFITCIGDPTILLIVGTLMSAVLLMRHQKSEAMTIALGGFGALGLNLLLKRLFERSRPELWSRTVEVKFYSFPSGHAMLSIVMYGLLGYLLATRYPKYRNLIILSMLILIALIGFSRMYLGVHWFTDIIAGYAAGFVWLMTCVLSLEIWRHRKDLSKPKF